MPEPPMTTPQCHNTYIFPFPPTAAPGCGRIPPWLIAMTSLWQALASPGRACWGVLGTVTKIAAVPQLLR